jgi:hypothetical protein
LSIGLSGTHYDEKQGAETRPTYYFYRHKDKPFHIDYVFVPKTWRLGAVEFGSFQEWGNLSDHSHLFHGPSVPSRLSQLRRQLGAVLNHGCPPLSVNQVVRLPLPPADCSQRTKACYMPAAGSLGSTPPSSAPPSTLPTGLAGTPRSCCGRLPTWFAWQQEPGLLFSLPPKLTLAAILSEPSPISPFAPSPFSVVKLPRQFGLLVFRSEMFRNDLATRSRKSLGLTSPRATALLVAPHEAAEAHWLDLP